MEENTNSSSNPSSIPPQPSTSPPSPPKKSKLIYLLVGFIILFILTVSSVAGVYIYKASRVKPTPTPLAQTPTPTVDPTASWKTYKSPNGFSLNYPTAWEENKDAIQMGNPHAEITLVKSPASKVSTGLLVSLFDNPNGQSLQGFINFHKTVGVYPNLDASHYVKNSSSLGISGEWLIDRNAPGAQAYHSVLIASGKNVIAIDCPTALCNDQLFDQILSTFQFTN